MGDKEYRITASQGQFLLQLSAGMTVPDKLGDTPFTAVDRAIIQGQIGALFTQLKSYSPYAQEYEPGKNIKLFFGLQDNWKQDKPDSPRWFMQDPKLETKIRLSKEALNGAAWVCFASLVPREADARNQQPAGTAVSPSEAEDTVWPMLKALGKSVGVRDLLGLNRTDLKKHGWGDDPVETAAVQA
jgi:hypothetical protein